MEFSDSASFERLTGRAFFTPDGDAGAIDLGNIEMLKVDFGVETRDVFGSIRGVRRPRKRTALGSTPIYSIDGNQFATPTLPLLLLGARNDNFIQSTATAATFTFSAVPGRAYQIGVFNLTVASVKVGATTKTPGVDYLFDTFNGIISLPEIGGTIVAGATVVVTYDAPAFVIESYTALSVLIRDGVLVVYAEDEEGPPVKELWTMRVTLTLKAAPERDPSNFSKWSMEALVYGTPTVLKRHTDAAMIADPPPPGDPDIETLLFDDGTIMGLG